MAEHDDTVGASASSRLRRSYWDETQPQGPRCRRQRSGLRGSRTAPVSSVLLSDDLHVVTVLVRRLLHEVPDLGGEFLQFLYGKPVDGGVVKGVQVPRVSGECHFLCPLQDLKSIWGRIMYDAEELLCKVQLRVGEDEDGVMLTQPLCAACSAGHVA